MQTTKETFVQTVISEIEKDTLTDTPSRSINTVLTEESRAKVKGLKKSLRSDSSVLDLLLR